MASGLSSQLRDPEILTSTLHPHLFLVPEDPSNNDQPLQKRRRPQRPHHTNITMSPETTKNNPNKQENHSANPAHLLGIPHQLRRQEIRVREEITINTRQHNTSESIILQHTTSHSLPTTLKRNQNNRNQNQPTQRLITRRVEDRHNQRRDNDTK
ncbi:hypothetical protein N7533_001351 [Penicillium manginii]|uniref:uncharacterized protein n=1 Tax=Penicillium manginii TaxID=203109 RepID=UPI0025488504|nr:uncharacterized protein N7533_001351 [Penicillium manginii]KAJ5762670.1 hypothetical protein N7533_001351 [Penicillium manginii]